MTATLLFNNRKTGPSESDEAVRRVAGGLERIGVGPGDVVCLMLHNAPEFLETMFATRLLGAYYCPINWHYKAEEAGWILQDSGAKAVVIEPALQAQIVVPNTVSVVSTGEWPQWRSAQPEWNGNPRSPGTLMPYTSGTTGRAKGVRRVRQTPEQLALLQRDLIQVLGIEPGMRALHPAPLYHSAPSSYALESLASCAHPSWPVR